MTASDRIREEFEGRGRHDRGRRGRGDKVKYGDAAQAETVRKMVVAMAKDIRVLLLKLCDRLHDPPGHGEELVPPESARRKAHKTLECSTSSAPHGTQCNQVGA